ncbi:hypothetical protein NGM10_10895 [Halorussus salilacus]|uniref:hypothetical protein n=1 Tax=Halorussus salilacus TaxID=2953750 RepID=UPI00209F8B84|nr:hypothetical protein [Halorussus salilacus]USZ67236.1 hypothetical protein NGM10_10895 [Halorussus salilacus]
MPSPDASRAPDSKSCRSRPRPGRRGFLRRTGLAFGSLGSLSSLAGCFDSRAPSDAAAVEAVEASLDALDDVDGYTVDIGGRVEGRARGETVTASLDGEQRVDETERRAHALVEADDDREELYVEDATVYEQCGFSHYSNVDDAWYPAETDADWREATLLGSQAELLDISEVYDRGTETRTEGEARVVEFAPAPDEYHEYQRRVGVDDEDIQSPDSVTLTQWLVDDRPVRMRSEVERGSLFGPTVEEEITHDVTYGPVSIELPEIVEDEEGCPEP